MTKPKVKITFEDYSYKCGDGCCDMWGTVTTVNGVELPFHNEDVDTIVEGILNALGYDCEVDRIFEED